MLVAASSTAACQGSWQDRHRVGACTPAVTEPGDEDDQGNQAVIIGWMWIMVMTTSMNYTLIAFSLCLANAGIGNFNDDIPGLFF